MLLSDQFGQGYCIVGICQRGGAVTTPDKCERMVVTVRYCDICYVSNNGQ